MVILLKSVSILTNPDRILVRPSKSPVIRKGVLTLYNSDLTAYHFLLAQWSVSYFKK